MDGQDYFLAPFLRHALDFFPVKVNFFPPQRDSIGATQARPPQQEKRQQVFFCVPSQSGKLVRCERLCSPLRILAGSAFRSHRVLCDHLIVEGERENAMQDGDIQNESAPPARNLMLPDSIHARTIDFSLR
jgi:hypothetical protein